MHILLNAAQASGIRGLTVMGGDWLWTVRFTLTMGLEILLGRYLQQFFHWYWNITRMHK